MGHNIKTALFTAAILFTGCVSDDEADFDYSEEESEVTTPEIAFPGWPTMYLSSIRCAGPATPAIVRLTAPPSEPIVLSIVSSNPNYLVVTPSVTMTSANWSTGQTITATGRIGSSTSTVTLTGAGLAPKAVTVKVICRVGG